MKVRWAAVVLGVALAAPAARAADDPAPTDKVKEHLGAPILAALKGATKVEAFRIEPRAAKDGEKDIGGFPIKATGAEQKEPFAKKIAAVLTDEKTLFGQQARCFLPGVAFRLSNGDGSLDVLICFGCKNLKLIARDAKGAIVKQASGAFGPDIAPLLALAREAFPDDKDLKEIKEKP
jgi:hypothetical protein